ncbi:hypothetical protein NIES2104_56230 [Leptolyngbya sp. NIES-2104]|nr:hypothetical protein NIES2104_56230 [Leptolyngbya sp. NIES-2104]
MHRSFAIGLVGNVRTHHNGIHNSGLHRSFAIGLVGNFSIFSVMRSSNVLAPILCDRISWK